MGKRKTGTGKRTFVVSIPIAGTVSFEVEAEDEETAKAAAWAKIEGGEDGEVTWEFFETLVDGNCLNVPQNEVEVTGGE